MAYNQKLAERIRASLEGQENVEEKEMFGGIAFMMNDKMCIGVMKDDIMLRVDPEHLEAFLEKKGARRFEMGGRESKSWLFVAPEGTQSNEDFDWWLRTAIESNAHAKVSKKKKNNKRQK